MVTLCDGFICIVALIYHMFLIPTLMISESTHLIE